MANAGQRYQEVVISGLAHLDAPQVVTSAEIDERLASAYERMRVPAGLLSRVAGIEERRVWDPGTVPSTVAAQAGERALQRSGVDPAGIGVLINTSVSRDYVEPATASIVHHRLGLSYEALNFDVGNACLGFINGMSLAAAMIERREIDHALVVCGESSRHAVESTIERLERDGDPRTFREQFATLTIGSGAVAMVLSRAGLVDSEHHYLGGLSRASTEHALLCTGQLDEMRTDARGLLVAGLEVGTLTWQEAAKAFEWDEAFDLYAVHQVSKVHTEAICEALGIDPARMPMLFPRFGNIGPAGVPTVLSRAAEEGVLRSGDRVALMGIGSGINAAAAEVVW